VTDAVLLFAHGTVDSLDELPEFLANIRRGHAAPPELVLELRRRYEAIGGKSPLNDINRRLAVKLEAKLGVPVRMANRLARPYARDVLAELAREGATRVAVVPLAQYSAHVYADAARAAARDAAPALELACAESWGSDAALVEAFASRIRAKLQGGTVVLSAHSLPVAAIRAGDPYERDFRASVAAIEARLGDANAVVAFQSQGMSSGPRPVEWLGPGLRETIESLARAGEKRVVVAPIGFLADHVEILYDLDVEAKAWADELGLDFARTESLDDADDFVDVLAGIARPLLART
jgi:ferrochelatase